MIQQASNEQINQNELQKKFFNGKWSKSEHERFLKGFSAFGKNWSEVQKLVKTRNLVQVRSHAQKHFIKTKEEEEDSCQMSLYSQSEDFFQQSRKLQTTSSRLQMKKTKLLNKISESSQKTCPQLMAKQDKESLLDIFKQAIEQQTLQIENESHSANFQCEKAMEMTVLVKEEPKQQQTIEKQKKYVYYQNIYGSWKVLC